MTTKYDTAVQAVTDCYEKIFADLEAITDPQEKLLAYSRIAANLEPETQLANIRYRADKAIKGALRAAKEEMRRRAKA